MSHAAALWFEDEEPLMHVTVMGQEVVSALAPRAGGLYVDCTVGGGGHSHALLSADPGARVIGFDRDQDALVHARERLAEFEDRVTLVHAPFGDAEHELAARGITEVDGLTADLGISSLQLDTPERGLSFRREGPIDMRMDQTDGETVLELISRLEPEELADIIFQLGDERRSRRIARCIKLAFDDGKLETTLDLRKAVVRATGPRKSGGVDPATRTFQALRIAVNDELGQLEQILDVSRAVLKPGGVAAFISFHSLEDRLVKRFFMDRDSWERLSKKPIYPGEIELADNPRSRSAKLRCARRLAPIEQGLLEQGLLELDPHLGSDFDTGNS